MTPPLKLIVAERLHYDNIAQVRGDASAHLSAKHDPPSRPNYRLQRQQLEAREERLQAQIASQQKTNDDLLQELTSILVQRLTSKQHCAPPGTQQACTATEQVLESEAEADSEAAEITAKYDAQVAEALKEGSERFRETCKELRKLSKSIGTVYTMGFIWPAPVGVLLPGDARISMPNKVMLQLVSNGAHRAYKLREVSKNRSEVDSAARNLVISAIAGVPSAIISIGTSATTTALMQGGKEGLPLMVARELLNCLGECGSIHSSTLEITARVISGGESHPLQKGAVAGDTGLVESTGTEAGGASGSDPGQQLPALWEVERLLRCIHDPHVKQPGTLVVTFAITSKPRPGVPTGPSHEFTSSLKLVNLLGVDTPGQEEDVREGLRLVTMLREQQGLPETAPTAGPEASLLFQELKGAKRFLVVANLGEKMEHKDADAILSAVTLPSDRVDIPPVPVPVAAATNRSASAPRPRSGAGQASPGAGFGYPPADPTPSQQPTSGLLRRASPGRQPPQSLGVRPAPAANRGAAGPSPSLGRGRQQSGLRGTAAGGAAAHSRPPPSGTRGGSGSGAVPSGVRGTGPATQGGRGLPPRPQGPPPAPL